MSASPEVLITGKAGNGFFSKESTSRNEREVLLTLIAINTCGGLYIVFETQDHILLSEINLKFMRA